MSDYFDRIERQLVRSVEAGVPRARRSPVRVEQLGFIAAVLVVVVVVAVFLGIRGHRSSGAPAQGGGVPIAFSAVPIEPGAAVGPAEINRAGVILRKRIDSVFPHVRVSRAGNELVVMGARRRDLAEVLALAAPGQLGFYDWEANALLTSGTHAGQTVASGLRAQNPAAITISQGTATTPTGSPDVGGVGLYQAVELAHHQPVARRHANQSHDGPLYYLFGASGSLACRVDARELGEAAPVLGEHCLLAGPESTVGGIRTALRATFGGRVTLEEGRLLTVPQGTVVLQAVDPDSRTPVAVISPQARFYVLKDDAALTGSAIARAQASTDMTDDPDVQLSFTSAGAKQFSGVTRRIARQGLADTPPGQTLNQHFAVAVDGKLITVPSIAYQVYPDGVSGADGADIDGGFTRAAAGELATLLRFGPLPVKLVLR
jgi:SecD/SecF fusion protein